MKKIIAVFHDNNMFSGGTMSYLSNVEFLNKCGHNILAIIPKKSGDLCEYLKQQNIKVIQCTYGGNVYNNDENKCKLAKGYLRCLVKTIVSNISARRLASSIKCENYDLVYTNTSTIYFGYWLAKSLGIVHIWHFREFAFEDQNSLRIFDADFSKKANSALKIFTISQKMDFYYRNKYHISNTEMLYDDIIGDYSKLKSNDRNKKSYNFLLTGTLSEGKGQRVAICAIEKLNNPNVHLYLPGYITQYGIELIKYCERKHLSNIHFLGLVKDMKSLRSCMDFSIVCSKSEAFGRTIIEDMLSDIIVIAGNAGSVTELVQNRKNGILYEQGNSDSLVSEIQIIINGQYDLDNMRKNAFEFAEKFTKYKTAKKISQIVGDIN